jgi:hypothetical protein
MILKFGNMWATERLATHKILITTNAVVKNDGTLVMGKGIAKQASDRYPELPTICGTIIKNSGKANSFYGCLMVTEKLGIFQTKVNWRDDSSLNIIERSTDMLLEIASNDSSIFNLNYPGIGAGNLTTHQVYPIIERLPDNVFVWKYQVN